MAAPCVLFLFVLAYLPVVGIIAFKDYRFDYGILNSDWVNLDDFRFRLGTDSTWRITRNTLPMNLLFISVSAASATATMNAPCQTSVSLEKDLPVLAESNTT